MSRDSTTVFLVEDNPADIFFVRAALKSEGINSEILVAQDGKKAIEFVEATDADPAAPRPQIILLDLNLPCATGMEVLRCLKRSVRCADVPVIIVTSLPVPYRASFA